MNEGRHGKVPGNICGIISEDVVPDVRQGPTYHPCVVAANSQSFLDKLRESSGRERAVQQTILNDLVRSTETSSTVREITQLRKMG